jgi:hypothetical protein
MILFALPRGFLISLMTLFARNQDFPHLSDDSLSSEGFPHPGADSFHPAQSSPDFVEAFSHSLED